MSVYFYINQNIPTRDLIIFSLAALHAFFGWDLGLSDIFSPTWSKGQCKGLNSPIP